MLHPSPRAESVTNQSTTSDIGQFLEQFNENFQKSTETIANTMRENQAKQTKITLDQISSGKRQQKLRLCEKRIPDLRTTFQITTNGGAESQQNVKAAYDFLEACKVAYDEGTKDGLTANDIYDVISTKIPFEAGEWLRSWRAKKLPFTGFPSEFSQHFLTSITIDNFNTYLNQFIMAENVSLLTVAKEFKNYVDPAIALIFNDEHKNVANHHTMDKMVSMMGFTTWQVVQGNNPQALNSLDALVKYLKENDKGRYQLKPSRAPTRNNQQTDAKTRFQPRNNYGSGYNGNNQTSNQNQNQTQGQPKQSPQNTGPVHPINALFGAQRQTRGSNEQTQQNGNQQQNGDENNEKTGRDGRPYLPPDDNIPCSHCNKDNHTGRQCVLRAYNYRDPFPEGVPCRTCKAEQGHFIWECPVGKNMCLRCKTQGHQAKNCPNTTNKGNPRGPSTTGGKA
jgi:hypothetical protein